MSNNPRRGEPRRMALEKGDRLLPAIVGRAIVDDDGRQRRKILRNDRFQRLADRFRIVVERNDD